LEGAVHIMLNEGEVRVVGERARRPRYWRHIPPV
jgi:hypothetical protein